MRRQIAFAIASGQITAGARLPTVRQLAGDVGVAPGTVLRADAELEAAGLVRARRGAGTTMVGPPASATGDRLGELTRRYVVTARGLGMGEDAIRRAVNDALGTGPAAPH